METSKSEFNYEFDVPFVDFNDPDDDDEALDEWFDVNHYEEDEPMQLAECHPPEAEQPPDNASITSAVNHYEGDEPMQLAECHPPEAEQPPNNTSSAESVNSEKGNTGARETDNSIVVKPEPQRLVEDDTAGVSSDIQLPREHCVADVKKEPESSEEDTTTNNTRSNGNLVAQQQEHEGAVKEEPCSTEEDSTDTEQADTHPHHNQAQTSTESMSEPRSTEEESTDTEQADTHPHHNQDQTSTESMSENESRVQTSNTRVTPRKRRSTPHKMIRRSMRKSNVVTSWSHRKRGVSANSALPRTRRSNPIVPAMNPNLKSSEQLELERIEAAKMDLEKTRQMSQQSLKMVRASHSYMPRRSQQPPTKPHGFQFKTDNRHNTAMELEKAAEMERERQAKKKARAKRRPVFKAPLLAISHTRRTGSNGPVVPKRAVKTFALQVQEFQNKTPDRFHSKPVYEQNKGPCPVTRIPKHGVTIPMSPALKSKTRKRPVTVLSTAEREELELEEIKRYKFKATPVDSAMLGCSRANTSMKSTSSKETREEEAEKFEFHARPVPSKMLEGVTGVSKPKLLPVTCPKSPAFALKNRIRFKEPEPPKEEEADKIKARPVPFLGIPFRPTLEHKITNPDPFSFANRDRETKIKKEEKIQEIYKQENEARIFHAQPAPDLTEPVSLPEKKVKPPTKMAPFHVDHDSAKRAEKWAEEVQKELEEQKKKSTAFKARPPNVLYQEPFVPEKPSKPLTDISDFTLNTEKRATEREEFERYKYEVQMKKMAEMEQQRRLEEEEEQRDVGRLRQEAVHKAQPIHHFKGVQVQPSAKPLTVAESPNFATDRRRSKMVDQ